MVSMCRFKTYLLHIHKRPPNLVVFFYYHIKTPREHTGIDL